MKIQNLIISIVLLLSVFSSCSNEELMPDVVQTGTFSVTFKSSPLIGTKAGTELATSDELNVESCFIGFFDSNDALVASSYQGSGTSENGTFTPNYGTEYQFRVEGITVPRDKELKVLVIANAPKNYSNLTTYSAFQEELVAYADAGDFIRNVRSLIKVGETTHTFTDEYSDAPVDLVQLAAKVKLNLTFEAIDEEIGNILEMGGENLVDRINNEYNGNGKPAEVSRLENEGLLVLCQGKGHGFGISGNHTDNDGTTFEGKWMVVKCDYVETKSYKTWELINPTIVVNNVVINSTFNIPNRPKALSLGSYNPSNIDISNGLELVFYTYQKELLDDDSPERLNVTISGTLRQVEKAISRTKAGADVHCMWALDGVGDKNGWGNGNGFVIAQNGVTGGAEWTDWSEPTTVGEPLYALSDQQFVAWINPKYVAGQSTDGLIQGNFYEVSGKVKVEGNIPVILSLDWIVKDWRPAKSSDITFN